jgi:hypothetical protein
MTYHYIFNALRAVSLAAMALPSTVGATIFLSAAVDFQNVNGHFLFRLDPAKDLPKDQAQWPGNQVPVTPGPHKIYIGNGASAQITLIKVDDGDYIAEWQFLDVQAGWKLNWESADEYDTQTKMEKRLRGYVLDDSLFKLDRSNPFEPVFVPLDPTDPRLLHFSYRIRVVPELTTWSMIVGGFGAIGGALRYRRRARLISTRA